jgi:hypothetical protein
VRDGGHLGALVLVTNLVDPDVYLCSGAPHEQFTWLREHAPVFWVRRWRETWLARRSPMAASASRLT